MSSNYELENKREQLDIWLRRSKLSRKQFAEEFRVSEATVYGWLSNTNIPEKRWESIRAFFLDRGVVEEKPRWYWRAVGVLIMGPDADKMEKIASEQGKSISDFIRDAALEKMRFLLGEEE
ncbi:MAG: hypothetical protein IJZ39_12235 [Oscillospiraceae bacterium]|uniref:hypothetical protein n=1 Tax=Fibrobacter sp. TaxID=35828 RepID=UPI0025B90A5C|nr:hypothetical protein [Fibrobacter sp.]MBQ8238898.1 hypothetical protein [Oscillospiraceae bacterium]MBR4008632.1 hypothetical protein [Fibrobacter sp.]